ncbi:metalloregulator ArsR/SmtB family transcription factor [Actinoplanes sp. NPDC051861]|uniref:ArsR/SmtB family transcription factor n=1 Tax=Actinoplanes sp. NPDC051861 TaxID=3155170 RepID=UPI00342C5D93
MDDVAAAIADPVRRGILEMLRERPLAAGLIAERFPISRPAVSRHLRVLRECGLVRDELVGRERVYRVDPERLSEVRDWIDGFAVRRAAYLEQRLDALQLEVHRTRRDRRQAEAATSKEARRGGAATSEEARRDGGAMSEEETA